LILSLLFKERKYFSYMHRLVSILGDYLFYK